MPSKEIKTVLVDNNPFSVVAYFQSETPDQMEWYDVINDKGETLNWSSLNEIPTDTEIEGLAKMDLEGDGPPDALKPY